MPNRTHLLVQLVADLWLWATTTGVSTHVVAQIGENQPKKRFIQTKPLNKTTQENLRADKDGLFAAAYEGKWWTRLAQPGTQHEEQWYTGASFSSKCQALHYLASLHYHYQITIYQGVKIV